MLAELKKLIAIVVTFRLVAFRPFKSEIIEGKIADCNEKGIKRELSWRGFKTYLANVGLTAPSATVSLDFFHDIFVPGPAMLFGNSR